MALREALVNAVVHRDLAGHARGTQVQVAMYPDRLVIQNPGGLFGAVTIDNLEDSPPSSARNSILMDILQEVPIPGIGLALLRSGEALTNPRYRAATGVDSRVATSELQDLVARELAMQEGVRRSTRYGLNPDLDPVTEPVSVPAGPRPRTRKDRSEEILAALGDETLSRAEVQARTDLPQQTVLRWLKRLKKTGLVESLGENRNEIRYRRTGQQRLGDSGDVQRP